jgi:hypothetical protein
MASLFVANIGLINVASEGKEFEYVRWKSGVLIPVALLMLMMPSFIYAMCNLLDGVEPSSLVGVGHVL